MAERIVELSKITAEKGNDHSLTPLEEHAAKAVISWVTGWATLPFSPVVSLIFFGETVRQLDLSSKSQHD